MMNLENEIIDIHQETIRREAHVRQIIRQSEATKRFSMEQALNFLGDLLIKAGTELKERACTKLTTEEATAPSFLIML